MSTENHGIAHCEFSDKEELVASRQMVLRGAYN